jgi:peptide/nickel transport system permease protein
LAKEANTSDAKELELPVQVLHSSEWRRIVRVFMARKTAVAGLVIIGVLILTAIFAPLIAPYDPTTTDIKDKLLSPSWEHFLGTDAVGRDIFSRIVYGARTSLVVGISTVALSALLGIFLGLSAAYFGGWVYSVIMRFVDALMTMPSMVLILLISGLVGGGIKIVIIALTIGSISAQCRVMCGQAMSVMQNDYILAGKATGVGNLRMMLRHVLPNSFAPLLIMMTLQFGWVILAEASLSFLGIGIMPPTPAWGSMVNEGYKYLLTNPVLSMAPGLTIMLVVYGFNLMGDGLRDALDPRLRGTF